jgi:hypothetical protein
MFSFQKIFSIIFRFPVTSIFDTYMKH